MSKLREEQKPIDLAAAVGEFIAFQAERGIKYATFEDATRGLLEAQHAARAKIKSVLDATIGRQDRQAKMAVCLHDEVITEFLAGEPVRTCRSCGALLLKALTPVEIDRTLARLRDLMQEGRAVQRERPAGSADFERAILSDVMDCFEQLDAWMCRNGVSPW